MRKWAHFGAAAARRSHPRRVAGPGVTTVLSSIFNNGHRTTMSVDYASLATRRSMPATTMSTTTSPICFGNDKNYNHEKSGRTSLGTSFRSFSSTDGGGVLPTTTINQSFSPPSALTFEMAQGIQSAIELYLLHGVGKQRLQEISKHAGEGISTLVSRWQSMMEIFLGVQVHVLSGLGFSANEAGLGLYNQQLGLLLTSVEPSQQEELRRASRNVWRHVLQTAFHVTLSAEELSIVDARNIMHKVSQRMQAPEILESVAQKCATVVAAETSGDDADNRRGLAEKHQIIQEVLVNEVYLGGASPDTLVEECGFGRAEDHADCSEEARLERGYVILQCLMAEHQSDPLVAQYIGAAMMKLLQSAGMDMSSLANMAGQNDNQS